MTTAIATRPATKGRYCHPYRCSGVTEDLCINRLRARDHMGPVYLKCQDCPRVAAIQDRGETVIRKAPAEAKMVTRRCKAFGCARTFEAPHTSTRNYCCPEHGILSRRRERVKMFCEQCGAMFMKKASVKKRFCSRECSAQARKDGKIGFEARICTACSTSFSIYKLANATTCPGGCA